MFTTLAEAKASTLKNIVGVAVTTPKFLEFLNEATRRLLRRGDWSGTVLPVCLYVTRGTVTWPRYVGQVRKINVCHRALPMRNLWYQFLPLSSAEHYHHHYGHHCGSHLSAQTLGRVPCINDVAGAGRTALARRSGTEPVGGMICKARFDLPMRRSRRH